MLRRLLVRSDNSLSKLGSKLRRETRTTAGIREE